ncbi:MAG: GAF domain-containing protein [Caulobacter sp.]|nr:GAF domain-containing protein [Caulobacter sp.]
MSGMPSVPPLGSLNACDREPIHIPGAIQPHGVLLVLDRDTLEIRHAAGDVAGMTGAEAWLGRSVAEVLGDALAQRLGQLSGSTPNGGYVGAFRPRDHSLDVSAAVQGDKVLVEIEPGLDQPLPGSQILAQLEAAAAAFERCPGLVTLYDRAALEFRRLTGFERVMVYRFGEDDAGEVVAESRAPHLQTFLNHRFPASDIPKQARALYVRNLVRVIPDATYTPAPLSPEPEGALDMSDCALRSVSPVHLRYLANMGVVASASVSIVKDGRLWGLIACHDERPRLLPYELRAACRALAGGLSRQIKAKEEAETYRERLRLRMLGDDLVDALARAEGETALEEHVRDLLRLPAADGVSVFRGETITTAGKTPGHAALALLRDWLLDAAEEDPVATDNAQSVFPDAAVFRAQASGLLGVVVERSPLLAVLWNRAEQVETVLWAGEPVKAVTPDGVLTPRGSFDAWSETVRGRAAPWSPAEVAAVVRLRQDLLELSRARRTSELNTNLRATLSDKDDLLRQKDFLLREVNHRVQNSLALAAGFLTIQMRSIEDPAARAPLEEASRRLTAVGLVHRRLYRGDQLETVALDRYLAELTEEMLGTLDEDWSRHVRVDAAPVTVSTDKAVIIGLVVTELFINAVKYAYRGRPGRLDLSLSEDGERLRLVVADQGGGKQGPRVGFGSRMMDALVRQMGGSLSYHDNAPGLRVQLDVARA